MENLLMARFDVYRNSGPLATSTPYLLDVQCALLDGLDTRVVIPLRRLEKFPAVNLAKDLTPVFDIEGVSCILETPKLAAIPARLLKTYVMSLADQQSSISNALDRLFHGY
jgi:toxin CcdB